MSGDATRVVLSYPADLTDWDRDQIETPWYLGYLRKTLGEPAVGDTYDEFVDIGCCGTNREVPLRVEEIEGGPAVGEDTEIEYVEREACGLEDAWETQDARSSSD